MPADHDETQVPRVVINPQVTYDVGDLLDKMGTRIDKGFAEVKTLLAGKADKSDLAAINARLDEHGREIGRLKDRQREDEAAQAAVSAAKTTNTDARQRRINIGLSAALVTVSLLGVLAAVMHW
jgi:hypothetical protein